MRVDGVVRAVARVEITGAGVDVAAVQASILEQVPEGFELLQLLGAGRKDGRLRGPGLSRSTAMSTIQAEGPDYASALAALRGSVPEGHGLLWARTIG